MKAIGLFPIPITISDLNRPFSMQELMFVKNNKEATRNNEGNSSSIDYEVLEKKELSDLKSFILDEVKKYFDNIICPAEDIVPYITLSWLNFTNKDGYHHRHAHSNSIISGVLYIQTTEDDKIWFYNEKYSTIEIKRRDFNEFNSSEWWLPAKENSLILFPSDLKHSVKNVTSDKPRISLAFNVFIKGTLGSKSNLTWLELN